MKKLLSVILFVLISLFPLTVSAKNESIISKDGLFEYQITKNNDVKLTKYMGSSSILTIPDKIGNRKVVSISKITFFTDEDIINNIKTIKLNRYVKSVNGEFFWYFPNLKTITVSKNNSKYSAKDGVLYNKDFTKIYAYPHAKKIASLTLLKSVNIIGSYAFIESEIKNIIIPETVKKIGPRAFSSCQKLKKVIIHKKVRFIGHGAFSNCRRLSELKIKGSPNLKIDVVAFAGSYLLKTVTFPECVPIKDNYAAYFEECPNLRKVIISDKVKCIPGRCFNDCGRLKSIYIPPTVNKIGKNAVGTIWDDALDDYVPNPKFTIKGVKGSVAEKYAKKNGLKFKAIK